MVFFAAFSRAESSFAKRLEMGDSEAATGPV
jgi:hypothetical protein